MSGDQDIGSLLPRRRRAPGYGGVRWLRIELEIAFSDRIPLPDDHIMSAFAAALPEMDHQGLLFPGITWPRPGERLLEWSSGLAAVGRRTADPLLVSVIEQRHKEAVEASLRAAAPPPSEGADPADAELALELLALMDDAESALLRLAEAAWAAIAGLREATERLEDAKVEPERFLTEAERARDALEAARRVLTQPGELPNGPDSTG